jgi:hypothetical protein
MRKTKLSNNEKWASESLDSSLAWFSHCVIQGKCSSLCALGSYPVQLVPDPSWSIRTPILAPILVSLLWTPLLTSPAGLPSTQVLWTSNRLAPVVEQGGERERRGEEVGVTQGGAAEKGNWVCPWLAPACPLHPGKGESDCQLGKGGKRDRLGRGREPWSRLVGAAGCSCFRLMKGPWLIRCREWR